MRKLKSFFITLIVIIVFYWIMDKLGWSDIVSAIVSSLPTGLFFLFGFTIMTVGVFVRRDYFFSKGHRLILKKQYELAIDEFINETRNKQKASRYDGVGYCYFMMGYNRNAITNFKIALELDENLAELHFRLAILYAEEKEFDLAFDHIGKGKTIQKRTSMFKQLTKFAIDECEGWVYHQLGDEQSAFEFYAKAIPKFDRMLKRAELKYHERFSAVYFRMAVIHKLKGEIEKAKEKFERSIQASPPSVFAQKSQEQLDQIAKESWSKPFKDSTFN